MYFDLCTLDIVGNIHLAYEFDEDTKETIVVFHNNSTRLAKYRLNGECLQSSGFSDEWLAKMECIVRLNANKLELYLNNGIAV